MAGKVATRRVNNLTMSIVYSVMLITLSRRAAICQSVAEV
jgi:hypothetical protein